MWSTGNLKDGKQDGPWEGYYDNGQLEFKGNYKKGRPHGPWEYYDEEGNLTETKEYKNGKLINDQET